MTVQQLQSKLDLETIVMPEPEKETDGVYAGDLLSWVMGRAEAGNIWVTIMTNINVLAVASLLDLSTVILAENSEFNEDFLKIANEKEINVLRSSKTIYEICVELNKLDNE
ncbi:hypothetical protein LJB90_00775 [Eubacteriales bacterium OttesenSCG-928-G02]|nr:hypothetical protein [Eubacteriales bacterium OttesenSCG-928-G02]